MIKTGCERKRRGLWVPKHREPWCTSQTAMRSTRLWDHGAKKEKEEAPICPKDKFPFYVQFLFTSLQDYVFPFRLALWSAGVEAVDLTLGWGIVYSHLCQTTPLSLRSDPSTLCYVKESAQPSVPRVDANLYLNRIRNSAAGGLGLDTEHGAK